MLRILPTFALFTTLACSAAPRASVELGDPLPDIALVDFTQTEADSLEDAFGQAVLLEFFAHW